MTTAAKIPVLAGVGQVLQRLEDPTRAAEPLELMVAALERAGTDCGSAKLLGRAEAIYVVRGLWDYGDPGREIARRVRATPQETIGTPYGGNFSQACVIDAARSIAAGQRGVALITGAENGRSLGQAQRRGIELSSSEVPGEPDRLVAPDKPIFHPAELARGINSASDMYALFESAIRADHGESLDAHARRIAELWADFNAVARDNPSAWIRRAVSAEEICAAGPDNPMISYPYTRLMNSNPRVDMAAAVIVCSLEIAREVGVPDEKLVYPLAAAEANDSDYASTRLDFHRSPGMQAAGARALERAGCRIEQVDHIDIYSCFPSAVQIAARELAVPPGRPLTVTGGLTFGGGPLNNYSLHAVARMAEVLRADPGAMGLVSANGGWLAKHAFGVYSTRPPRDGFGYDNPQAQVDALPQREALVDFEGDVTIEAYTVAHRGGEPGNAHAACLTEDGRRTWATSENADLLDVMMREEFCGRRARIEAGGKLSLSD
jgi:acetyl-CoA C-acetyltransferase